MFKHCQFLGWKQTSFEEKQRKNNRDNIFTYLHIKIIKSVPPLGRLARDRESIKASCPILSNRTYQEGRFSSHLIQAFLAYLNSR